MDYFTNFKLIFFLYIKILQQLQLWTGKRVKMKGRLKINFYKNNEINDKKLCFS